MGKKTIDPARQEMIEQHVAWAAQQAPVVGVLVAYTKGCSVYAPLPKEEPDPKKFTYHKIDRIVLLPPRTEDGAVALPENYGLVVAGSDKSKHIVLYQTFEERKEGTLGCYVEVVDGCTVVLPGGREAHLRCDDHHKWKVEEPTASEG